MNDIVVKQQHFSLAPRDLTEAMKFAEMMAHSDMVPKCFKGKPGDVLIAVQMGNEVGLAPMAAIQNIAVINGKPGIYGDAGKAILLAHGCIIEEDDIEVIKQNGRGRCKITRKGRPPVERTFSVDNAKTAGLWNKEGPWRAYPERQMAWRAFWFAARDAASDLLKGLGGIEELADITEKVITGEAIRDERKTLPPYPADNFATNLPKWRELIDGGRRTADEIISMISSKAMLTEEQQRQIRGAPASESTNPTDGAANPGTPELTPEEQAEVRARELLEMGGQA